MNIWVDANGWPFPPIILLGCFVAEILYFRGWRLLVKEAPATASAGVKTPPLLPGFDVAAYQQDGLGWRWRGTFFLGAILTLLVASSAPIDNLSGRLFWVHMVQHLLLLVIMAPLLVLGSPLISWWLGLPAWARRFVQSCARLKAGRILARIGRWLLHPVISCLLLIAGIWVWHWPGLYDLALTNDLIHDWCEHSIFIIVSVLFWCQVIPTSPLRLRLGYIGRMCCVGVAIAQNFVLAVLLGFAPVPLYAPYAQLAHALGGLTALQDQQLGAGIMWTFGDVPFGIAVAILVQQWLASQSDDTQITAPVQVKPAIEGTHAGGAGPDA
ncbi:MAG: cytochrome c oxidase assembly protein [Ktedonobacteraceae bacterium]|nr:cytochrome c oxidase assembly protein [Chloroflexota bacterium]